MEAVLVTGACTNTGVDIVEMLAEVGDNVIFTGRDVDKVKNKEKYYQEKYPNVFIKGFAIDSIDVNGNVDEDGVISLFNSLDKEEIFISGLVLNAVDQALNMEIFKNPLSDFIRVMNTNIIWNYCLCEQAALRMKEHMRGSIVFINSNTAYRAIPNRIAYSTSKGGQLGMMRALALDLGKYNIRVNAILPGMIKTQRWIDNPDFYKTVPSRFTPLGDVAIGRDVAEAVVYFMKYARNTTGAELVVDGGNTIQLYPIIPKDDVNP